ncbi:hypothetical protein HK097_011202 [Rhizophlyctis rosea]|uniref:Cilia- and flagella-associated protein 58 central coiled coil domain-containing protein n=1 Tax=Rhizophlyctis rosea TaxID=64517 RepID=A0AAD5SL90_9FUNG|nr:hypothetical protein HK097_011202 [Rhizophlyctis rosea]
MDGDTPHPDSGEESATARTPDGATQQSADSAPATTPEIAAPAIPGDTAIGNPPAEHVNVPKKPETLAQADQTVAAATTDHPTHASPPQTLPPEPETPKISVPGEDERDEHDHLVNSMNGEVDDTVRATSQDDIFAKFRAEYEKMHRAAIRSWDHSQKMFSQYRDYYGEFLANDASKQESAKTTMADQQTLKTLKAQIKRAEEMVEASGHREELSKEELRQLRADVTNLNATLKQGVGLSAVQERTLQELTQTKEQATKELEQELEKIVRLRNSIIDMSEKIKQADQQKRDFERETYDLKEKGALKKSDIDQELRTKERLERDLRELRVVVAVKSQEVRGKQDAVNRGTDEINVLESQIKNQKQMMEKLMKDEESLTVRTIKLQEEADQQMTLTSQLMEENAGLNTELKIREMELAKNRNEVRKVGRIKEALAKKIKLGEEQKLEAEMERKDIRALYETTLADIESTKHLVDSHKKSIDDLTRERGILANNYEKASGDVQKSAHMSLLCRQTRHNIELELARFNKEVTSLSKHIKQLEADRDGYIAEAAQIQALCVAALQDIKQKEIEIFEYKKRTMHADTKLKHQQNLYEAVQSDRNLHSKHLVESLAEIAEMKRKLKIINFQINGYKEDINAKDAALANEAAENAKLTKEVETINEEIKTLKYQVEVAQSYIRAQTAEEMKLTQFVKEAESERARQENALQVLISERDNLNNQLIRRNEELAQVYNKIKTQTSALVRGEIAYRERLKAITNLQTSIRTLRAHHAELKTETSQQKALTHQICRLTADLTRERTRMKALEEELENPINVHRWRKLEGSNPKAFELLQMLHTVQKKLIAKAKEDSEKEQLIQCKEQLYLHLKSLLAKQVGPEAIEQVGDYKRILKDKTAQLNHMETELNMYQAQVREHRYAIAQLDKGMRDVGAKFMKTYKGALGKVGKGGKGLLLRDRFGVPLSAISSDDDRDGWGRTSRTGTSPESLTDGEVGMAAAAEPDGEDKHADEVAATAEDMAVSESDGDQEVAEAVVDVGAPDVVVGLGAAETPEPLQDSVTATEGFATAPEGTAPAQSEVPSGQAASELEALDGGQPQPDAPTPFYNPEQPHDLPPE